MPTDPNSSPLAFFGSELKRLRQNAGITQQELATRTVYSLATVSAYETGTRIPSPEFAQGADKVFGTDGDLTRLQGLVQAVSVRPWFRDRVEVERMATEIWEYETYQITGLLQLPLYARAIVSAVRPTLPEDVVGRAVALRLTRQEILEPDETIPIDQENAPRLWTVMDESALRMVGSPEIMQAQREHLATMMQRPNITVQVIRSDAGPTCAFGRAFAVLIARNGSSVVYLEDVGTARYIRDRDEVSRYRLIFEHLRASALDDKQSLKLIKGEHT